MPARSLIPIPLMAALLLAVGLLLRPMPSPAMAQCENPPPSSCVTCHAQEDPVSENGEWHIIHASKDICVNCHGGNGSAVEKDLAHASLVAQPLSDIYTDCHSCHPDYEERAGKFAPILGVTPGSCATPTPAAARDLRGEPPAAGLAMPSEVAAQGSLLQAAALISTAALGLTLFLLALRWLGRHPA
jgi:hypothetical protein